MAPHPTTAPHSVTADWWWVFDPRTSLRARTALIAGGGALLLTILMVWFAGTIFRRQLENHLGQTFEILANQVGDKIDRSIYERRRDLQLAASLPPFRGADVDPVERRRLLDSLLGATPDFAWLGFATASGTVVVATQGLFEQTNVSERPWFRVAREKTYVGAVHEIADLEREVRISDEETSPGFIDLATPVMSAQGQFLGVLAAHARWSLARNIQLSVIPEAARRGHLGVTIYGSAGEVWLDSGGSGWNLPPEAPALPDRRRARGSMLETTAGGTTYVTGYSRSVGFREFRGLGGLVTVRQPVEDAFAPVRELQRSIELWGSVLAGFVAVAGWLSAAQLARRVSAVTEAARRIRNGDVTSLMPRAHDASEIAQMCGALDAMVEDFREKQEAGPGRKADPSASAGAPRSGAQSAQKTK